MFKGFATTIVGAHWNYSQQSVIKDHMLLPLGYSTPLGYVIADPLLSHNTKNTVRNSENFFHNLINIATPHHGNDID